MTAYPGQTLTWTMLGKLYVALWDSQSRPVVIQPGIEPESLVTPLALRCSALDHCAIDLCSTLGDKEDCVPHFTGHMVFVYKHTTTRVTHCCARQLIHNNMFAS